MATDQHPHDRNESSTRGQYAGPEPVYRQALSERGSPQGYSVLRVAWFNRLTPHYLLPKANCFMTVSGLSPTFATAASMSVFDFLKRLRQWRANVLSDTLTRRWVNFVEVDMTMGEVPVRIGKSPVRLSFLAGKAGNSCPLWVKSRHMRSNKPCPLYTQ
jgi:hypothetical protein